MNNCDEKISNLLTYSKFDFRHAATTKFGTADLSKYDFLQGAVSVAVLNLERYDCDEDVLQGHLLVEYKDGKKQEVVLSAEKIERETLVEREGWDDGYRYNRGVETWIFYKQRVEKSDLSPEDFERLFKKAQYVVRFPYPFDVESLRSFEQSFDFEHDLTKDKPSWLVSLREAFFDKYLFNLTQNNFELSYELGSVKFEDGSGCTYFLEISRFNKNKGKFKVFFKTEGYLTEYERELAAVLNGILARLLEKKANEYLRSRNAEGLQALINNLPSFETLMEKAKNLLEEKYRKEEIKNDLIRAELFLKDAGYSELAAAISRNREDMVEEGIKDKKIAALVEFVKFLNEKHFLRQYTMEAVLSLYNGRASFFDSIDVRYDKQKNEISCPENKIGLIIGKKGSNIAFLNRLVGKTVNFNPMPPIRERVSFSSEFAKAIEADSETLQLCRNFLKIVEPEKANAIPIPDLGQNFDTGRERTI